MPLQGGVPEDMMMMEDGIGMDQLQFQQPGTLTPAQQAEAIAAEERKPFLDPATGEDVRQDLQFTVLFVALLDPPPPDATPAEGAEGIDAAPAEGVPTEGAPADGQPPADAQPTEGAPAEGQPPAAAQPAVEQAPSADPAAPDPEVLQ
jgi:hypothetical protein